MKAAPVLLAAATLLAAAVVGSAGGSSGRPTLFFRDAGQAVPPEQLHADLAAFQSGISDRFASYWLTDARVTDTDPRPGDWVVNLDDSYGPCGFTGCVLGYHGLNRAGVPFAVVFVPSTEAYGVPWEKAASHEFFEMLADPYVNRTVTAASIRRASTWLVEVSDPVASLYFTVRSSDGRSVPLADFVTPSWFMQVGRPPYDADLKIRKPFKLAREGYASYYNPTAHTFVTLVR